MPKLPRISGDEAIKVNLWVSTLLGKKAAMWFLEEIISAVLFHYSRCLPSAH